MRMKGAKYNQVEGNTRRGRTLMKRLNMHFFGSVTPPHVSHESTSLMVTTLARRSTSISRAWFGLALVILTGFQFRATATVMTNAVNSGMGGTSPSAFDANISALDLVNTGQLTLSGTTATAPTFPPYTLNGLHDGAAATDANLAFWLTHTTSVTESGRATC